MKKNELENKGDNNILLQDISQSTINVTTTNVTPTKPLKKNLTPPPFLSNVFIGRDQDLKNIHQALLKENNLLLLVNGEGGIGKTTIAAFYFHQYQAEYHHMAWVYVATSILDALLSLLRPLQVPFEENWDKGQRLEALLIVMSNLPKPCLLVIDNANEVKDLDQYYQVLNRCSNFHILLTTRINHFEQATTYKVLPLKDADAVALFQKHYPAIAGTDLPLLKLLFQAIGHNTLVIELLAKNLQVINRFRTKYSLTDLLKDLNMGDLLALSQSKEIKTTYQSNTNALQKATPESIIGNMYDLGYLVEREIAVLSIFAVLPAEKIPLERILELIKWDDFEEHLGTLSQKGWLDFDVLSQSIKISPVVQEICKQKNEQLWVHCQDLVLALIEQLHSDGGVHLTNTSYENANSSAYYGANLIFHLAKSNPNLIIIANLFERLSTFHQITGDLIQSLHFAKQNKQLLQFFYEKMPQNIQIIKGFTIACEKLGEVYLKLGKLDKALSNFELNVELSQQLYDHFRDNIELKNGLATAYSKLGEINIKLGNLEKALSFFELDKQLTQQLYEKCPQNVQFKNSLAISYSKLGQTHFQMENLDNALHFFENQTELLEELHKEFPQNVQFKNSIAVSYSKLGQVYAKWNNIEKALFFFEKSKKLFEKLYKEFRQNIEFKNRLAISYSSLGSIYTKLGNWEKASHFFKLDMKLQKQLYEEFPKNVQLKNGLAISYWQLGDLSRKQSNTASAKNYFQQAQILWQELHQAAPNYIEFKRNLDNVNNILQEL